MEAKNLAPDAYLLNLQDEREALDRRDQAAATKEAEARAEREAVAKDRARVAAAEESYRAFLGKTGGSAPLRLTSPNEPSELKTKSRVVHPAEQVKGGALDGVTLRIGPQRLRVLEAIGRATAEGKKTTNRQISQETDFSPARVSNILFEDSRRKLLDRDGDEVSMTRKGFEFLRLIQSPVGRLMSTESETPTTH